MTAPTQALVAPNPYAGLLCITESPIATKFGGTDSDFVYKTCVTLATRDDVSSHWARKKMDQRHTHCTFFIYGIFPSTVCAEKFDDLGEPNRRWSPIDLLEAFMERDELVCAVWDLVGCISPTTEADLDWQGGQCRASNIPQRMCLL